MSTSLTQHQLTTELVDQMLPHVISSWEDGTSRSRTLIELRFVSGVLEEAGEFIGAFHRWAGLARRNGSQEDVESELADVIISATSAARVLGIDLDRAVSTKLEKILTRGWKEK